MLVSRYRNLNILELKNIIISITDPILSIFIYNI